MACIAYEGLVGRLPELGEQPPKRFGKVGQVLADYLVAEPQKRPTTLRPLLEVLAGASGVPLPALDPGAFRRRRRASAARPRAAGALVIPPDGLVDSDSAKAHPNLVDTMPEESSDLTDSTSPVATLTEETARAALSPAAPPPEPWQDAAPTIPSTTDPTLEAPSSEHTEADDDDDLPDEDTSPRRTDDAQRDAADASEAGEDDGEIGGEDTKPRTNDAGRKSSPPRTRRVGGAARDGTVEIEVDEEATSDADARPGRAVAVRTIEGAASGGTMEIVAGDLIEEEPAPAREQSEGGIDPRLLRAALGVTLEDGSEPKAEPKPEPEPKKSKRSKPELTQELGEEEIEQIEQIEQIAAGNPPAAVKPRPAPVPTPSGSLPPAPAPKPARVEPVRAAPPVAAAPVAAPPAAAPSRREPAPAPAPSDYLDGELASTEVGRAEPPTPEPTPGLITRAGVRRSAGKWILLAAIAFGALIILAGVLIAQKRREDTERERRLQQRFLELQEQAREPSPAIDTSAPGP